MFARSLCLRLWIGVSWVVYWSSTDTLAKDYFLTIGGGYDPTGNQLSLERNVVFQQAVLKEQRPDKPACDVYFADGDGDCRDVQCRDPEFEKKCPAARRMMAEIFGDADSMDLIYRGHEVPNERGPAEKSLIRRRLRVLARDLTAGDRLVIYVTGHGSPADGDDDDYEYEFDEVSQTWKARAEDGDSKAAGNKHNTSFYAWDTETVSASELVQWLDRFDRDVEVVLVMVQCYAGGFAHTIFNQADSNLGLSRHARCGFFAQVHDRGAAGCTADANEADYEEYSSYFWGALGGRTRTGEPIKSADYNGDGKVSFAEAHSYAVLESNTIDIPVRTSGALLRCYSHIGKVVNENDDEGKNSSDEAFGGFLNLISGDQPSADTTGLAELKGPIAELAGQARPDQRAILERLPAKLGMKKGATVEDVRRRLKQVEKKSQAAAEKLSAAETTYSNTLDRLHKEAREIWPELHATYAPLSMELTSERAEEFVERVGNLAAYESLREAAKRVEELSKKQLELARTEARLQRLLQTCEEVVLCANLPQVAPAEIAARYEKLLAMEEGTLVP